MRVVVIGATGNVGSAVMRALKGDDSVSEIVGVARRVPRQAIQPRSDGHRAHWRIADIGVSDLGFVEGADVVIDLAWMIQPSRDEAQMRRTNVVGTQRILDAIVSAGVPKLIYASSVGTYAQAPKSPRVDEAWSTSGIPSSTYSRHKAEVEAMLDATERANPDLDIVRMRTSLVFQRAASSEIHRLFLGRLLPWHLPRPFRLIPRLPELQFQATHADDVAEAYRLAVTTDVRGPFNIAAEPVLTSRTIADVVGGRTIPLPRAIVRVAAAASYRARLQPSEPGWLDLALDTPLMNTSRAVDELGWVPQRSSIEAIRELFDGIGDGAGSDTPPLVPRSDE